MKRGFLRKMLVMATVTALMLTAALPVTSLAAGVTQDIYGKANLLANPGFEQTQVAAENDGNPFVAWIGDIKSEGAGWSGFFAGGESRTGATAGTAWAEEDYTLTVKQDFKVDEAGKYEAGIYIGRGAADYEDSILNIKSGDEVVASAKIGGAAKNSYFDYRLISIKDIDIKSEGQYTFEIVVPTKFHKDEDGFKPNSWIRLDDAYFTKQVDNGNILQDPSFEQTQVAAENDGNPFKAWIGELKTDSTDWSGFFPGGEARTNASAATTWAGAAYTLTLTQEVEIADAGKYEAGIWLSRGIGNYGETALNIKSGADIVASAKLPAKADNDYNGFRYIGLKDINIANAGKYTFEVVSKVDGPSDKVKNNLYLRIDDAYLGKQIDSSNVLKNASFEQTQVAAENDGNPLADWVGEITTDSTNWTGFFAGGEAIDGATAATSWGGDPYILVLTQNFDVTTSGNYDASVWISRGPAIQGEATLNIKSGDSVIATATLGKSDQNDYTDFRQIFIKDISVEAGTYTFEVVAKVGGSVDATKNPDFKSNPYLRIDDAFFGMAQAPAATVDESEPSGDTDNTEDSTTTDTGSDTSDDTTTTPAENPKTGDTGLSIYIGLLAAAVLGAAVVVITWKKKQLKTNS